MACSTLQFTTVAVTQLDLAPLHAGKVMGLTYTIGNLGSVAAPQAVSALTYEQSTRSQWQLERVLSHVWSLRCRRCRICHLRFW